MSGGGAGTAATDISVHLRNSHGLVLMGFDSAGNEWDDVAGVVNLTDTYADQPSVLRYILEKGISDAGGNPFDGVSAFEPLDDLDRMQDELDGFMSSVDTINPEDDIPSWLAVSETAADGLPTLDVDTSIQSIITHARINASQVVADAVMAAGSQGLDRVISRARVGFEKRAKRDHLNSLSQFTGAMSDMQAVNTSAFVIGMAKMQRGYDDRLAAYESEFAIPFTRDGISAFVEAFRSIALQHMESKARVHVSELENQSRYVMQATNFILEQTRLKTTAEQSSVEMQRMVSTANIVAQTDEMQTNLDIDVKSQNWDLELFQQAGNIMSAVSGSVVPTAAKPNRFLSGLAGAAGGASVGLAAGGPLAPYTAIAGGVAGAVAGYYE